MDKRQQIGAPPISALLHRPFEYRHALLAKRKHERHIGNIGFFQQLPILRQICAPIRSFRIARRHRQYLFRPADLPDRIIPDRQFQIILHSHLISDQRLKGGPVLLVRVGPIAFKAHEVIERIAVFDRRKHGFGVFREAIGRHIQHFQAFNVIGIPDQTLPGILNALCILPVPDIQFGQLRAGRTTIFIRKRRDFESVHRIVGPAEPHRRTSHQVIGLCIVRIDGKRPHRTIESSLTVVPVKQQDGHQIESRHIARVIPDTFPGKRFGFGIVAEPYEILPPHPLSVSRFPIEIPGGDHRTGERLVPARPQLHPGSHHPPQRVRRDRHLHPEGFSGRPVGPPLRNLSSRFVIYLQYDGFAAKRRDDDLRTRFRPLQIDDAFQRHVGRPFRPVIREPVFRPHIGSIRGETGLFVRSQNARNHILIEQTTALKLHVLPRIIRKQFLPDVALIRQCPTEHLPSRLVVPLAVMHHPEIPVGPPCSEIFVARTNDVIRFRPQKIILAPFRKILAVLPVIGPIVNSAVVPHDHRSGINEFQIFRRRNARIGPTVIRLRNARAIMPHGIRLKPDSIGRQPYIDAPGRPRQQIEHPDDTACAAVRVFAGQIIHRI